MTYRKGEVTSRINERLYPYIVEIPVPENGFGTTLDLMHVFHANIGANPHGGRGRYEEGQHFVRWCFGDPQHAASFQAVFGGKIIRP